MDFEEKLIDGIVRAIKAAKMTPEQVSLFRRALIGALECEPEPDQTKKDLYP